MGDTIQWITFLTLVAHSVVRHIRENRQRAWDKEDREEAARKVEKEREKAAVNIAQTVESVAAELEKKVDIKALELARKVVEEAEKVSKQVNGGNKKISDELAANTEVSTEAFKEANRVNLKLAKLGLEHNELQTEQNDLLRKQ